MATLVPALIIGITISVLMMIMGMTIFFKSFSGYPCETIVIANRIASVLLVTGITYLIIVLGFWWLSRGDLHKNDDHSYLIYSIVLGIGVLLILIPYILVVTGKVINKAVEVVIFVGIAFVVISPFMTFIHIKEKSSKKTVTFETPATTVRVTNAQPQRFVPQRVAPSAPPMPVTSSFTHDENI